MFRLIRAAMFALLTMLAALGGATVAAFAAEPASTPILIYHRFHPTRAGSTTTPTPVFAAQLAWLAKNNYHGERLHDLVTALYAGVRLDPMAVVITVDDGHRSVYTDMYPLILRYRMPVTLFVVPEMISNGSAALTWEQLAEMHEFGLVDVELHTFSHPNLLRAQARRSAANFRAFVAYQLELSRAVLSEQLGVTADLLAWPYGLYDARLEQLAADNGYIAAVGIAGRPVQAGDDLFALPRMTFGSQRYPRLAPVSAGEVRLLGRRVASP